MAKTIKMVEQNAILSTFRVSHGSGWVYVSLGQGSSRIAGWFGDVAPSELMPDLFYAWTHPDSGDVSYGVTKEGVALGLIG
jgi:hypothetical protein